MIDFCQFGSGFQSPCAFLFHTATQIDKNVVKLILSYAGKILTIETLPVRLRSPDGKRPVVDADQTCYFEDDASHVLHITRIFYCYGTVHEEVIGINNRFNCSPFVLNSC